MERTLTRESRAERITAWIEAHRPALWGVWTMIGVAACLAVLAGPRTWEVRGAPLHRGWAAAALTAVWIWAGLRWIALWRWAWVALAAVPILLYLPLRPFLGAAAWLTPLLLALALLSAAIVALSCRRRTSPGSAGTSRSGTAPRDRGRA